MFLAKYYSLGSNWCLVFTSHIWDSGHERGGVFYNAFYGYTLLLVGSVKSYIDVGGFGWVLPRCGELGGVLPCCRGAG